MSRLDTTAASFIDGNKIIRPVYFVFLDFAGAAVRATNAGMNLAVSGSTQPDLNGTYLSLSGDVAELSPIKVSDGGSAPVSVKLSGLRGLDDDMLAEIFDETQWKGRLARIWRIIWNSDNAPQGTYQHLYTGYMVDVVLAGNTESQLIEITIENYLAAFSQASNRTYINSKDYDPGDRSGEAAVTAANGAGTMPGGDVGSGSGGSITLSGRGTFDTVFQ
jgi:hypothetical protein